MNKQGSGSEPLALGELIAALRRQGFTVGVGHYLRLQKLLDSIDFGYSPERLKTLLCPIFATNEKEQQEFRRAFDAYFDLTPQASEPPQPSGNQPQPGSQRPQDDEPGKDEKRPRWRYTIIALSVIAIGCGVWFGARWIAMEPQQPAIVEPAPRLVVEQTDTIVSPTPTPDPQSHRIYEHPNRLRLAAVLIPLICFAAFELYRLKRRRLILEREKGRTPPDVWPPHIPSSAPKLYEAGDFYTAARELRRRQMSESLRLDVEATISATIKTQGYPSFRYRFDSKPPEYLALIERESYADHRARLFGRLTGALGKEGVFIERYFYHGDPQVCYHEHSEEPVYLVDLQRKYSNHRLIVFGDGAGLLDSRVGELLECASLFEEWRDRALLTPKSPALWGRLEVKLEQLFFVLPATMEGILALPAHFELQMRPDLRRWRHLSAEAPPPVITGKTTIEELRGYLGEECFQWLCACAIYPELDWDVTLHLGALGCMPPELLREKNLMRLANLPWFRSGAIPNEWRRRLIQSLDPEIEKAIRAETIKSQEKSNLPSGAFTADGHEMTRDYTLMKSMVSFSIAAVIALAALGGVELFVRQNKPPQPSVTNPTPASTASDPTSPGLTVTAEPVIAPTTRPTRRPAPSPNVRCARVVLETGTVTRGAVYLTHSGAICAGDRVALKAKGPDRDGDTLLYSWISTGGRIVRDDGNIVFDTTGLAPGDYTITAEVNDGRGCVASGSKTIRVDACPITDK